MDDVTVTQKRPVTEHDQDLLKRLASEASASRAAIKVQTARVLDYASFREVSELTGISTNTLQRWKKEAGK